MQKLNWKYVFLTVSSVGFAIALIDHEPTILSYISLPLGVVLFGLFLIATVMEKESALYDEQNRAMELARSGPVTRTLVVSRPVREENQTFVTIHSH